MAIVHNPLEMRRTATCKRWTYKGKTRYIPVIVQDWPKRNTRIELNEPQPNAGAAKKFAQTYINESVD
jgi:hypothetical protein